MEIKKRDKDRRHLKDREWYDLSEPHITENKKPIHKIQCEFQHPQKTNEYVVRGYPEGETELYSFILIFGNKGLKVTPSKPPQKISLIFVDGKYKGV
ncbi:hypothetical protein KJ603_02370 [Patescibacteria group bacterium]|nr:hypothetical protein [Patescibacteria group bacterium]